MHQLTKTEHGPWYRMMDQMILDEYIDEVGKALPGAPALIRPEHYLSNMRRDRGKPWTSDEHYFPDEDLSLIGTLLELDCFDEPTAVRLYLRKDDPDLEAEPATDWIALPTNILRHDEESGEYVPFTLDGMTVGTALDHLASSELNEDNDGSPGYSWGPMTESRGEWTFEARAMEMIEMCRLHLILYHPDSNNQAYQPTEWGLSHDVIDLLDSYLTADDLRLSYELAHDRSEEPYFRIERVNPYKGGGFSCLT